MLEHILAMGVPYMLMAFLAGMGAGVFYFGGLWWTVRRLPSVRQPALLTLGSFFVRTGLSLAAFYFASGGHWERILASLLGFMIMRGFLVRRMRSSPAKTATS
jgi:F1F0 ATPase subunit 2